MCYHLNRSSRWLSPESKVRRLRTKSQSHVKVRQNAKIISISSQILISFPMLVVSLIVPDMPSYSRIKCRRNDLFAKKINKYIKIQLVVAEYRGGCCQAVNLLPCRSTKTFSFCLCPAITPVTAKVTSSSVKNQKVHQTFQQWKHL